MEQDAADAEAILKGANLAEKLSPKTAYEATEKYLIETRPMNAESKISESSVNTMRQKGIRKPHYTRLFLLDQHIIFQAACCLPLEVIAASLNGKPVSGRILFCHHTDETGGKLVYEFSGRGTEMIIDVRRGESTKAQRLIFKGIGY
jgi:hypothetical protein